MEIKKKDNVVKDFAGLMLITVFVILFFTVLNSIFGQGDELVAKMKEERIAKQQKLSKLISSLPSGVLVTFDGTKNYKLTDELYEAVCEATKLIPQRAIMGANFLNHEAYQIYTNNGNLIEDTFVRWENNICIAGYTVVGPLNDGTEKKITVSGEALSFLSTGIDSNYIHFKLI